MTWRVAQILVLSVAWTTAAGAQSPITEIRSSGQFLGRTETPEMAGQLALLAARTGALREATADLRRAPEVQAIPLRPNELDAIVPSILDITLTSTGSETSADGTVYRADVVVRLRADEIARRLDKLRKDPNAVSELMGIWKESGDLYKQLSAAVRDDKERQSLIDRFNAQRLVARVIASLARIEEGPASTRVTSPKGLQRALQLAEIAMVQGAGYPETHLAMGDALMESVQSPEAAEAEYRQALLLAPNVGSVHIKLAEALRREEKLPEAIAELREALRLDPSSALAHTDLGFIFGSQQKPSEAIAEYQEALRINPDFIDAHNHLAIAFARQQRLPEAVAEFREMVRIDPDSALGYYNLGVALADLDEDDESAEALRHVVRINPNHYNAHYNIAELFRLEGKLDEAVKQFREYLRLAGLFPEPPEHRESHRICDDAPEPRLIN